MKKIFYVFFCLIFLFAKNNASAQTTYASPVAYMNDISKVLDNVQADLWSYTNAVSHNKSARKIEKRRNEIIETIKKSKDYVWKMPSYKGDRSLKDSAYSFLKVSYAVMTEDYSKLVNMEDISEQSYDAMEAYLLAKEIASAKQDTSVRRLNNSYKTFAANNNITLNDKRDETAEKLSAASAVYNYYNVVYLIFFKSFKQEIYVMDALNKTNVSAIKQNTDALSKFAAEGLKKMDTLRLFKSDASLKSACKEALTFYKTEADTKLSALADFLVKKETFEKVKKSMEAKPQSKRTQADVDDFNKAVTEFNSSLGVFNSTVEKINADRAKVLSKWNTTAESFIDKHVPKN
jgi:hypothetical protein